MTLLVSQWPRVIPNSGYGDQICSSFGAGASYYAVLSARLVVDAVLVSVGQALEGEGSGVMHYIRIRTVPS